MGAPIRMAQDVGPLVKRKLYSAKLGLLHRSVLRLVDPRSSYLELAHPLSVRPDSDQRSCPLWAASELFPFGAYLLVVAVLLAWATNLRRWCSIRLHHRRTHRNLGSTAHLLFEAVVFALPSDHSSLGLHAAGRPAGGRSDYVGSGESGLPGCRIVPVFCLAEGE